MLDTKPPNTWVGTMKPLIDQWRLRGCLTEFSYVVDAKTSRAISDALSKMAETIDRLNGTTERLQRRFKWYALCGALMGVIFQNVLNYLTL